MPESFDPPLGHDHLVRTLAGNQCTVHSQHRPTPLRTVLHHVWPQGDGGPTEAANLLRVCDTGHYNIHALLAELRAGRPMTGGSKGEREAAQLGFDRIGRQAL